MNQADTILKHLKSKPITSWECTIRYFITQPATRIFELKAKGHNIESIPTGEKGCVEYRLITDE
ncbi:MAG: hypothetical protein GY941_21270 [Planctomycetes bacterium]|nr:hypothetical protein [Planctomycetota bacterium]